MILVLRLKGDQKMFSDVGESLSGSTRELMFSLLCVEKIQLRMQKESTEYGNKFRNLQPNHKVQQWRKFPVNPQKKKAVMIFLTKE